MQIDLNKPDVHLEDIQTDVVKVSSNALRGRIRDLISQFMSVPRPLRPTDAEIMNEYMKIYVPEFARIKSRLFDLEAEMEKAPKSAERRLKGQISALHSQRLELISNVGADDKFLIFRSDRRRAFNDALSRYESNAMIMQELKPYLGMPHLPDIEASGLSAEVILSTLSGLSQKAPQKGQMVLMLDEAIHTKPQFVPRSAFKNGISQELRIGRDGGAVRVPYSPDDKMGVEAMSLGAFERRGHVYFKLEDGKPVSQVLWNEIDRYLPFACRSLSVPLLPVAQPLASGFDFVEIFGESSWQGIEEDVFERHSRACTVCGSDDRVSVVPRWRFREPVIGSYGPGVQQLDGFITMCWSCHDTFRPSLESLLAPTKNGHVLDVSRERTAWIRVINRWTDPKFKDYAKEAYLLAIEAHRRRSRTNWIINLESQRESFFLLVNGIKADRFGWIWPNHRRASFKIVGAAFYESEDHTRNYFTPPSIFNVPWNSTVADVSKILENHPDLAAADDSGAGFEVEGKRDPVPRFTPDMERQLSEVSKGSIEVMEVDTSKRPSASVPMEEEESLPWDNPSSDGSNSNSSSSDVSDDDFEDDDEDEFYSAPDYN